MSILEKTRNLSPKFPTPNGERTVYHISPLRRFGLWIAFSPIMLACLAPLLFVRSRGDLGDAELKGLLMCAFLGTLGLIMQLLFMDRAKLTLSPAGVKLKQTGYKLETSWENIVGLRLERGSEAFITGAPLTGKGASLLAWTSNVGVAGAAFYDQRQRELLQAGQLIPIEAFGWHFKHGNLSADIARYAPHLRGVLEGVAAQTK